MSRINDTGPPSNRSPNMCNYSSTNKALISKQGPRRNYDTGLTKNELRQCINETSRFSLGQNGHRIRVHRGRNQRSQSSFVLQRYTAIVLM
ncbi:hypothetical protein TNCV_911751 [Trichonephila clavipes]|nr:hypothetical protein TNCV_911751 [Trichonephila clavipes]